MTMTRRTALAAAVAAIPATVVALPLPAVAADRSAWNAALAEWRRIDAENTALYDAWEAADDQLPARPSHLEFLGALHIREREQLFRDVLLRLCFRDFGPNGYPANILEAKAEYEAHLQRLNAEADKLTDELIAWRKQWEGERRRLRVDELHEEATNHRDESYFDARDKLAQTPAPDTEALLFKMEMAADFDSEEYMRLALDDARRLLAIN